LNLLSQSSTLSGEINIPGSKSHTIRAIAIATMAEGTSILTEALDSADTHAAINAAKALGATVNTSGNTYEITGIGNSEIPDNVFIDVANSGTTLRIFSALAALFNKPVTFDGDHSIRTRIMTPLFSALKNLGASIDSNKEKCPFTVTGPIKGGKTPVDGISSQFLTAVLFATPLSQGDSEIIVENLHEKPYVNITLDWLDKQNIRYQQKDLDWFRVSGGQSYKAFKERIAADFSSATFAVCAAAITKSELLIKGLDFKDHQGDKQVFEFLVKMGLQIEYLPDGVLVQGRELTGTVLDLNDTPDALPAIAATACFAKGTTRLVNVKQARLKECDRIAAMATELTKMGAHVEELPDGLIIHGGGLTGTNVHGYHDHRMVMALAIAGMGANGITSIDTAEAIGVTYPGFVEDYKKLGANFRLEE
jgi:3-phosphoshikimate 1-carboxyvinyltransferase